MKRHLPVTFDLDRETRNQRTERALHEHGMTNFHVLTMGGSPTLVLLEAAHELGFVEVMKSQGWDYEKINSSSAGNPAYWVRHPSPFLPPSTHLQQGRVFPPDSLCPFDVDAVRHPNNILFVRVDRGKHEPEWRASPASGGDDGIFAWSQLSSTWAGDGVELREEFVPKFPPNYPTEDLRNPLWQAVGSVVTFDRLQDATTPATVVDLVYDAVAAALKAVGK